MSKRIILKEDEELIFRRYRRGKDGKITYPKRGKAFPMVVKKSNR